HADQVAGNAVQLGDNDPNDLRLLRYLHAAELLDRHGVAKVHVHPRQVIHAVGVGDELDGQDVFADLLSAAVQIAEVRRDFRDHLTVGPQHQAEHAVRAGVLRSHVDEHFVGADVKLDDGRVLSGGHKWIPYCRLRIADCRLQIAFKSAICNLQSG